MSGEDQRTSAPQEPPWSVDLLADLHAGALDDDVAAQLWAVVEADPAARDVLAALESTGADLAALPSEPMPSSVATRIDAALYEEAARWATRTSTEGVAEQTREIPAQPATANRAAEPADFQRAREARSSGQRTGATRGTGRPSRARSARRRGLGWGAGLVAAAAAILGVVVTVTGTSPKSGGPGPTPGSPTGPDRGPLALRGTPATIPPDVFGARQYGPLAKPERLQGCLAANGSPPSLKPMGVRQITVDGKPGTLIVLPTGNLGQFRLLTVGQDCAAGRPATVANTVVGN